MLADPDALRIISGACAGCGWPTAVECFGGAEGARTPDPRLAKAVLSQLSYSPTLSEVLSDFKRMPKNILAQFEAKKQRGRLSLFKASTPCFFPGM